MEEKEQEETVPDTQASNVCVWEQWGKKVVPAGRCICGGCQKSEKIQKCVPTGGRGRGKETSRGLQRAPCAIVLCSGAPEALQRQ